MSFGFDIKESNLVNDVKIIKPIISEDCRGNIWTSFIKDEIDSLLPKNLFFKHDKFSQSKQNVLRGMHGDFKSWKLVTCIYGEIYQVVADLRKDSNTYLKWHAFTINKADQQSILIPPGLANAYYVMSSSAVYHYKLAYEGSYVDADEQYTVAWNDKRLKIQWPCSNPLLSDRDAGISQNLNDKFK